DRTETTLILGKPVRYRLRRSRRARRINFHVTRQKGLEVVLPWRWALRDVGEAMALHADWIDRAVDAVGVRHGPRRRELVDGATLPVLGEPRRLELRPLPAGRSRARVTLTDDVLRAELPAPDLLDPRPALRRWLRRQARGHLEARVAHLAALHDFDPRRVIVGERRSRWGSCSSSGTLSFCDRLFLAPPAVIDAVVCHELSHLRHMNHGPRFRALVRRLCPDHDRHMRWLRDHHDDLEF
ncbi:MAG TPA: SprT family zinc-dependent metalloprotease, partial [Candidatus Krumholzibacteria bacterium]|nr:SprT family zinc-dependent metalloprotease [Candidatus Krumholzibacteria bacterium]HRX52456.1 SprT family zinc-dependent metalloprotease [Candidatus Krumholzibacteria bacterium]